MQVTNPQRLSETSSIPDSATNADVRTAKDFYDPIKEGRLFRRLDYLRTLGDNWDGDGAAAISSDVIDAVERFCRGCISAPVPAANPTPDGGVQLEWHIGSRSLEIEFEPSGIVGYICWDRDSHWDREGELSVPSTDATASMKDFQEEVRKLLSWVKGE